MVYFLLSVANILHAIRHVNNNSVNGGNLSVNRPLLISLLQGKYINSLIS
jgi:hypothetical protein